MRLQILHKDLLDVIGHDAADHPEYCRDYCAWEYQVAAPRLRTIGWKLYGWRDGDRDSFGPLTRYCVAELDGKTHHLMYG